MLESVEESTAGKDSTDCALDGLHLGLVGRQELLALHVLIADLLGADAGLHKNNDRQLGHKEVGV